MRRWKATFSTAALALSLADSFVRVIPTNAKTKVNVTYADIAALAFTGRDTAAGKTFDAWVKKYWEKKAAGEKEHPD